MQVFVAYASISSHRDFLGPISEHTHDPEAKQGCPCSESLFLLQCSAASGSTSLCPTGFPGWEEATPAVILPNNGFWE